MFLEIDRLTAGYGAVTILRDVSLSAAQGAVTIIIGPNGAGKTTLLSAVMGLARTSSGTIRFEGRDITRSKTWDQVAAGLVLIPEGRLPFADMSVEDNLLMGAWPQRARSGWRNGLERVYGLFPRLKERRKQLAGSLSGGEAQMLAIGRGLMESPKALLIDEPSQGLAPVLVGEIFSALGRLKAEGLSMILVEQNTHRALALADHVVLMRSGRVAFSDAATEVDLDRLHALYFSQA